MSHFTTIQTQIRDLEALRDASVELGLGFLANTKCRGYAGVTRLAPHVTCCEQHIEELKNDLQADGFCMKDFYATLQSSQSLPRS
jgi:hypothetical protein